MQDRRPHPIEGLEMLKKEQDFSNVAGQQTSLCGMKGLRYGMGNFLGAQVGL
jgi:hypothetical protein